MSVVENLCVRGLPMKHRPWSRRTGQAAGGQEEDRIQQHEPLGGALACRSQGIRIQSCYYWKAEEGTSVWEPDTGRGKTKGARTWEGPEWVSVRGVGGRSRLRHLPGRGLAGAEQTVGTVVPCGRTQFPHFPLPPGTPIGTWRNIFGSANFWCSLNYLPNQMKEK